MYEDQTQKIVLQRMLDQVPADVDKREGSVAYDMLVPPSVELERLYVELDNVLKRGFASTAYGEWLDKKAAEVGLERKEGESDEDLRARYFQRVRKPAASGNKAHYVQWALEVPGVGAAKCFDLWNGPGTVKVVFIDSNRSAPSPELVAQVQAYIESQAPIGAAVTVEGARTRELNISFTATPIAGKTVDDIKAEFEPALDEYLASIAFAEEPTTIVRWALVGNIILSLPSVVDYHNLIINGSSGNIVLDPDEIPVREAVMVS